jgi:predicted nucleic acid-binding protein
MLLGLDTGFFISYHNRHPRALTIWDEYAAGEHVLAISTLSVNELFTYFIKRNLVAVAEEWLTQMRTAPDIRLVGVSSEIAAQAARYRLGLQLPTVDAIILTTFLLQPCDLMVTTDSHFQIVQQQNLIPVEYLT